jgi:hypothetical protein
MDMGVRDPFSFVPVSDRRRRSSGLPAAYRRLPRIAAVPHMGYSHGATVLRPLVDENLRSIAHVLGQKGQTKD